MQVACQLKKSPEFCRKAISVAMRPFVDRQNFRQSRAFNRRSVRALHSRPDQRGVIRIMKSTMFWLAGAALAVSTAAVAQDAAKDKPDEVVGATAEREKLIAQC